MPKLNGFTAYDGNFRGSDITAEELEFILAVAAYQKRYRRRYPTWREVLHVARCLGYRKVAEPTAVAESPAPEPPPDTT